MILASLEESAVLKAYNAYWECYVTGDVTGLASLLVEDYTQIGSVEGEVFNNKKDAVAFIQSTIDQIAGKVDMRNRKIALEPVEHSVLVTEQTDLYILIDGEWNFYAKFRASSLMQKMGDEWKFVHQHSSMPDIRAEEGENIASEKIARENIELRDAIRRRTIELEQKNEELAMEAALERVRSVAMGMRKPEDLPDICEVLYTELQQMGFSELRNAMINIYDDDQGSFVNYDYSDEIGKSINLLTYNIHPVIEKQVREIRTAADAFSETVFSGKDLDDWKAFRKEVGEKDDPRIDNLEALRYYFYSIGTGSIGISTFSAIAEEKLQQLKRFRNVFDFAYRRYTDVAQAEAQAREAQIEAALERVRSKTMAMHNSKDVGDTVATMFDEFVKLGIVTNRCGILIFSNPRFTEVWTAKFKPGGGVSLIIGHLDTLIHPMLQGVYKAWGKKETYFSYELVGDDIKDYYRAINNARDYPTRFDIESIPNREIHSDFFFAEGAVFAFTPEVIQEESSKILKRFAGVFGQTYRRFLDLQKAEAQAREATIEAALERVRYQAMAMQNSDDVGVATATLFTELDKLGVENVRCGIAIISPNQTMEVWSAANTEEGKIIRNVGLFDMNAHPLWQRTFKGWSQKEEYFNYFLTGEEKQAYFKILSMTPGYVLQYALHELPDQNFQPYFFPEGAIWSFSLLPHTEEENKVFQRFTAVFSLTFRRYMDLKKAETQAREATVEAALEKVRGKAMAMHNSNDLTSTASMVFTELRKLGISPIRCGVGLLNRESRKALLYSATTSEEGDNLLLAGYALLDDHPVIAEIYDSWYRNEDYFPMLKGELLKSYFKKITSNFTLPDTHSEYEHYGYFLPFSEGSFYGWLEKPLTEAELKILNRFKVIIDLTFRRYIELQKSETNAREAVRRASLDRVRAEIASMRTINDLDRITPLIWSELTILGVPFIRCGVFIIDEELDLIHTFLSTPEGKALASFHLPFDVSPDMYQAVVHWRNNTMYQQHWDEAAFLRWTKTLMDLHAIPSSEAYTTEHLPKNLYLNFLPFRQGMLYVGNEGPLLENDLHVVQNLADAFSTAYARYEDFKKLEEAKEQVDKTLTDLKQAQAQLVQAEKMASLGELTAGIAHEIQNPLNFVNNFSEINRELSDEILEAAKRGDMEEIKLLATDIKANQEKVSVHGKRADSIVKGMLQHSRSSSGTKEPTDINKLADEYLRLAYHGIRAKDKDFNATLHTDFDAAIEMVPLTPQDIGRVLLNLYNNAFYAVAEKKKHFPGGYDPIVTVTSKLLYPGRYNGAQSAIRNPQSEIPVPQSIIISVKDNGMGIPAKVKDKIFQPFFTTKPTGQGTGLGLSLSYDIIKAHNGEMSVESTEGEGTIFTLSLPVK